MTFQLPRGYVDEAGTLHREVEITPLTGKEEELVAQSREQESATLVTTVLSRCLKQLGSIAPVPEDVTDRLPVEDSQFLLLKLREITFGDRVQATVTCPWPDCGNKVDINFSTKDITGKEPVDKEPKTGLELEANCAGCGREFTIPFDIPGFFFKELRTSIDLLYREVHVLAYHYHWSEKEILEMPGEKRHKYIEILLEEIEKMTDQRILPPPGFRYGNVNYPFILDPQPHESLTRCLHPQSKDKKMEVKGTQDPGNDAHEMNHHRLKTRQNRPMKNETMQDSYVRDIEIPGFSEKSIRFTSLSAEKGYVIPRQEKTADPALQKNPQNKSQINSKSQLTNKNQIPNPGLQTNSKSQMSNFKQKPNSGLQTKTKSQTANRPGTSDLENLQSQNPEPGSVPPSPGANEPRVFTQKKDKIEFPDTLTVEDNATETQLPGRMEKSTEQVSIHKTNSKKLQESSPVKKKTTDTQLPGKKVETADEISIPIPGTDKFQKPRSAKDKPVKVPSQPSARMEKAVSSPGKAGEPKPVKDKAAKAQFPERMEKSTGYDVGTGESKVKAISTDEIVSRLYPESARRIEQLREQVRRLNAKKSSAASHSSHLSSSNISSPSALSLSSSGIEGKATREIKTGEKPSLAAPPDQPVTIVKPIPTRTNTNQTTSAFWERSYLGRFHLKTLR